MKMKPGDVKFDHQTHFTVPELPWKKEKKWWQKLANYGKYLLRKIAKRRKHG